MPRPTEALLERLKAGTPRERGLAELLRTHGSTEEVAAVVRDYRSAFPKGSRALVDEEIFCGMRASLPFNAADPNGLGLHRMEGRREVFFRRRIILSLDPDEIEALGRKLEEDAE